MVTVEQRPTLSKAWALRRLKKGSQAVLNLFSVSVWSILRLNCLAEAKVFYLAQSWWDTVVNRVSANLLDKKHV